MRMHLAMIVSDEIGVEDQRLFEPAVAAAGFRGIIVMCFSGYLSANSLTHGELGEAEGSAMKVLGA